MSPLKSSEASARAFNGPFRPRLQHRLQHRLGHSLQKNYKYTRKINEKDYISIAIEWIDPVAISLRVPG